MADYTKKELQALKMPKLLGVAEDLEISFKEGIKAEKLIPLILKAQKEAEDDPSDESGSDESGSDESGSDESGSDESGADESGEESDHGPQKRGRSKKAEAAPVKSSGKEKVEPKSSSVSRKARLPKSEIKRILDEWASIPPEKEPCFGTEYDPDFVDPDLGVRLCKDVCKDRVRCKEVSSGDETEEVVKKEKKEKKETKKEEKKEVKKETKKEEKKTKR